MAFRFFKRQDKTIQALTRTRASWYNGLTSLFQDPVLSDEEFWEDVAAVLVSADIGVTTSLRLVDLLRERIKSEGSSNVMEMLKEEIAVLLDPLDSTIWDWYDNPNLPTHPIVIMVVGVNGVGKTTSIAKLARHYQTMEKKVIIGAGDTFRAAAIEQSQIWGERLGIEVIAHQQGSDPGAVAYDSYQACIARGADVLIIDTAGRLHNNQPLIEELRKVRRVLERFDQSLPHQTMLVLDATTGHNGLEQAKVFKHHLGATSVFLAKLDGTAKGGIAVAIAQELSLPVVFIGSGEDSDDLSIFDTDDFIDALFEDCAKSG